LFFFQQQQQQSGRQFPRFNIPREAEFYRNQPKTKRGIPFYGKSWYRQYRDGHTFDPMWPDGNCKPEWVMYRDKYNPEKMRQIRNQINQFYASKGTVPPAQWITKKAKYLYDQRRQGQKSKALWDQAFQQALSEYRRDKNAWDTLKEEYRRAYRRN